MLEDKGLRLKCPLEQRSPCSNTGSAKNLPSDDDDFEKQLKKLELGETNLKYSMRRRVAGFLTLCAAAIMLVYLIHLLVPERWHWLTSAQLDRIESVSVTVFGGLVMSIGTLFYSKK